MIRIDGRNLKDIRPIRISNNIVSSASSSIQLSIGSTTVLVAVFNKLCQKGGRKKLEIEFDSFGQLSISEINNLYKTITNILKSENLKFFPEYEITINIFIIEDDGNLLTVLLNCISQSFKQIDVLKSKELIYCEIGILDNDNKDFCVDPSKHEMKLLQNQLCYVINYDPDTKTLKIHEITKTFNKIEKIAEIKKNKLYKLVLEFGFYLFKIFN